MIRSLCSKIVRVVALPAAAFTLVAALGTPAAWASTSNVCGNGGSGYCLNDWGGAGAGGDAVKMEYGGYTNDAFLVVKVNRCSGKDTVQSAGYPFYNSTNCPFGNADLDYEFHGDFIVEIMYVHNEAECVATNNGARAYLDSCATPLNGAGGANGVIQIISPTGGTEGGYAFLDKYLTDEADNPAWLASGGNPGVQAYYTGLGYDRTAWGGSSSSIPDGELVPRATGG
jgi:hypothetical protein